MQPALEQALRAWVGLLLEADETALLLPVGAGNRDGQCFPP